MTWLATFSFRTKRLVRELEIIDYIVQIDISTTLKLLVHSSSRRPSWRMLSTYVFEPLIKTIPLRAKLNRRKRQTGLNTLLRRSRQRLARILNSSNKAAALIIQRYRDGASQYQSYFLKEAIQTGPNESETRFAFVVGSLPHTLSRVPSLRASELGQHFTVAYELCKSILFVHRRKIILSRRILLTCKNPNYRYLQQSRAAHTRPSFLFLGIKCWTIN